MFFLFVVLVRPLACIRRHEFWAEGDSTKAADYLQALRSGKVCTVPLLSCSDAYAACAAQSSAALRGELAEAAVAFARALPGCELLLSALEEEAADEEVDYMMTRMRKRGA